MSSRAAPHRLSHSRGKPQSNPQRAASNINLVGQFMHMCRDSSCASQHSTAQHSTSRHNTARNRTVQHGTAQHSTAQHSTAQHSIGQCRAAQLTFPEVEAAAWVCCSGAASRGPATAAKWSSCENDSRTTCKASRADCLQHINQSCQEVFSS